MPIIRITLTNSVVVRRGLMCLVVLLASCHPGDAPTAADEQRIYRAPVGSSYTYSFYSFDSTGVTIPGSESTIQSTIIRWGVSIAGKDSAFAVGAAKDGVRDTSYYAYDGERGFSMLLNSNSRKARWLRLPVTGGSFSATTSDTVTLSGQRIIQNVTTTALDEGAEEIHQSEHYVIETRAIDVKTHEVWLRGGLTILDGSTTSRMNFAPFLGYLTTVHTPAGKDAAGVEIYGTSQDITDHDLK